MWENHESWTFDLGITTCISIISLFLGETMTILLFCCHLTSYPPTLVGGKTLQFFVTSYAKNIFYIFLFKYISFYHISPLILMNKYFLVYLAECSSARRVLSWLEDKINRNMRWESFQNKTTHTRVRWSCPEGIYNVIQFHTRWWSCYRATQENEKISREWKLMIVRQRNTKIPLWMALDDGAEWKISRLPTICLFFHIFLLSPSRRFVGINSRPAFTHRQARVEIIFFFAAFWSAFQLPTFHIVDRPRIRKTDESLSCWEVWFAFVH